MKPNVTELLHTAAMFDTKPNYFLQKYQPWGSDDVYEVRMGEGKLPNVEFYLQVRTDVFTDGTYKEMVALCVNSARNLNREVEYYQSVMASELTSATPNQTSIREGAEFIRDVAGINGRIAEIMEMTRVIYGGNLIWEDGPRLEELVGAWSFESFGMATEGILSCAKGGFDISIGEKGSVQLEQDGDEQYGFEDFKDSFNNRNIERVSFARGGRRYAVTKVERGEGGEITKVYWANLENQKFNRLDREGKPILRHDFEWTRAKEEREEGAASF